MVCIVVVVVAGCVIGSCFVCMNGAIEILPAYDEGQTCLTQNEKIFSNLSRLPCAPFLAHEKDCAKEQELQNRDNPKSTNNGNKRNRILNSLM